MNSQVLDNLREREKELNCLYKIHEILKDEESPLDNILRQVVSKIPDGWQFPGICMAMIECEDIVVTTPGFFRTKWMQKAGIFVEGNKVGEITVFYKENLSNDKFTLFLAEEQQLLNAIAQQLSQYVFNRKIKQTLNFLHTQEDMNYNDGALLESRTQEHWKWRLEMAEYIAEVTDFEYYGILAIYVLGSVKEGKAGPKSDLDLLIHFRGSKEQKLLLQEYMNGWSKALAKLNYDKTGMQMDDGIIDLHIVTTQEINNNANSFAAMINNPNNSARLLKKRGE
ncbi:MAG: nucleotidyltransferase domain-containing protein [Bacteroidales bacterium]